MTLVKDVVESDNWREREYVNTGCHFNHNHTKLTYEDRIFLTLNSAYLLNLNSLSMGKIHFVWDIGWDCKKYMGSH
jgi:hypothetical protein